MLDLYIGFIVGVAASIPVTVVFMNRRHEREVMLALLRALGGERDE